MVSRDLNQQPERDLDGDGEGEGLDFDRVKELLGFVLRAPKRRPFLAIFVFLVVAGLGVGISKVMPRTYNSQVKLLAETNFVLPALSNPGRQVPTEAENPTKDLGDQIMRRDNLTKLAKDTNLVEAYYAARSPALKLKDKLLGGTLTPDDKLQIVVATLEKNVSVTVENSNVIIAMDWYEPKMAYTLVTTIQKNFQAARYDNDVAMITEAISVLTEHAKTEEAAVDAELEEYRKLAGLSPEGTPPAPGAPRAPRAPRRAAAPGSPAAAVVGIDPDLADALEEKRQQIRSLEAQRQRDLETLRGQLAQAELTLTPQHPTVIALQQKIDARMVPDPDIAQLKADERALMAQIAPPLPPPKKTGTPGTADTTGPYDDPAPTPPPSTLGTSKEDPRAQLVRAKLESAIHRYQDAVSRIDSANVELEIARTAFKYRYTVVTPAEVPNKPKKATATGVAVGSVIAAFLLAFIIGAAADMWAGRIIEPWQVQRTLGLQILGEVDPLLGPVPPAPPSRRA